MCDDPEEINKSYRQTLADCAHACRIDQTEMFIYANNKGTCSDGHGCHCLCEVATSGGKCWRQIKNEKFHLYAFTGMTICLRFVIVAHKCAA